MTGDKCVFGRRLYEHLRKYHRKHWDATHGENFVCPDGVEPWIAKRDAARIAFAKLTKKAKAKLAKALASENDLEPDMLEYIRTL